jgi:hypothetical protein
VIARRAPAFGWAIATVLLPVSALSAGAAAAQSGDDSTRTPQVVAANQIARGALIRPDKGPTRLLEASGSPFAVMVFRDPGIDRIAIIHQGEVGGTAQTDTAWSAIHRFWNDSPWSNDVNAIVRTPAGDALFVSTGGRGSGAVFRLDLRQRVVKQVWPSELAAPAEQGEGRSCEILGVDAPKRLLHVRYQAAAERKPVSMDLRLE